MARNRHHVQKKLTPSQIRFNNYERQMYERLDFPIYNYMLGITKPFMPLTAKGVKRAFIPNFSKDFKRAHNTFNLYEDFMLKIQSLKHEESPLTKMHKVLTELSRMSLPTFLISLIVHNKLDKDGEDRDRIPGWTIESVVMLTNIVRISDRMEKEDKDIVSLFFDECVFVLVKQELDNIDRAREFCLDGTCIGCCSVDSENLITLKNKDFLEGIVRFKEAHDKDFLVGKELKLGKMLCKQCSTVSKLSRANLSPRDYLSLKYNRLIVHLDKEHDKLKLKVKDFYNELLKSEIKIRKQKNINIVDLTRITFTAKPIYKLDLYLENLTHSIVDWSDETTIRDIKIAIGDIVDMTHLKDEDPLAENVRDILHTRIHYLVNTKEEFIDSFKDKYKELGDSLLRWKESGLQYDLEPYMDMTNSFGQEHMNPIDIKEIVLLFN